LGSSWHSRPARKGRLTLHPSRRRAAVGQQRRRSELAQKGNLPYFLELSVDVLSDAKLLS
jgi:hypothetical protein